MESVKKIIKALDLKPHPEGGYYRETYRSKEIIPMGTPPDDRSVATSIYYLLTDDSFSQFHRIKYDEMWYFHQGDPVEILMIQNKCLSIHLLGNKIDRLERPQVLVPGGTWFAAGIKGTRYALISCAVSPGFDFRDFETANRKELIEGYPYLRKEIIRFTQDVKNETE